MVFIWDFYSFLRFFGKRYTINVINRSESSRNLTVPCSYVRDVSNDIPNNVLPMSLFIILSSGCMVVSIDCVYTLVIMNSAIVIIKVFFKYFNF